MEFKKMNHFTFMVIFHLKMIVCQNFNLPHILVEKRHLPLDFSYKKKLQPKISLSANDKLPKTLVANNE